jgi:hypothetical protein
MSVLLSTSLYEYFSKKGESHKSIGVGMPFSMRQPVKDLKNFRLDNDMVGMPVEYPVIQDFDKALKVYQKIFKALKSSLDPFGVLYLFRVTVNLPFFFPKIAIDFVSNKFAIIFSNSHMTRVPLRFNGMNQR